MPKGGSEVSVLIGLFVTASIEPDYEPRFFLCAVLNEGGGCEFKSLWLIYCPHPVQRVKLKLNLRDM